MSYLDEHTKLKHDGVELCCNQCASSTLWSTSLVEHKHNKHEGTCHNCNQCSFTAANNMDLHIMLSTNIEELYICVTNVNTVEHREISEDIL